VVRLTPPALPKLPIRANLSTFSRTPTSCGCAGLRKLAPAVVDLPPIHPLRCPLTIGSIAFPQGHARRSLASLFRSGRGKSVLSRV